MIVIILLVFLAVFGIITSILLFGRKDGSGAAKKQTVAALEAALGLEPVTKKRTPALNFRKSEMGSAIPFLNRRLEKLAVGPRLRRLLSQADMPWTPGKLILMTAACFALVSYLIEVRTGSAILAGLAGAVAGFMPTGYVLFKRSQRFGRFEQGLPEALELMVSALRVGHSFNSVMGLVTRECPDPIKSEFRIVFDEQNYGLDIRSALTNLCERVPLQDLKIAVTAILIQRESGGNLAEVLDKTAYVIRQRFRLKKQVMVHTAQGRLTGLILTVLPIALGVGLYIANPDTMSLLWKRELGIKLLCGAGCMLIVGTALIQKIVRMDV